MKIAEYKQIDTRTEQRTRVIPATYDDNGNILTEETTEAFEVEVPVMGLIYRDATEEEIAEAEEQARHRYDDVSYEELVSQLIREKYTLDDELAISRQRDTKPEEFNVYFAYCEECKAQAKSIKEGGG